MQNCILRSFTHGAPYSAPDVQHNFELRKKKKQRRNSGEPPTAIAMSLTTTLSGR